MTQQPDKHRGFASPLQKAQAGKIGRGKSQEQPTPTPTPQHDIKNPDPEPQKEKVKREETHFRQTVWMPIPLNRRLKIHAAKTGDDISGIINKLVEAYLNSTED